MPTPSRCIDQNWSIQHGSSFIFLKTCWGLLFRFDQKLSVGWNDYIWWPCACRYSFCRYQSIFPLPLPINMLCSVNMERCKRHKVLFLHYFKHQTCFSHEILWFKIVKDVIISFPKKRLIKHAKNGEKYLFCIHIIAYLKDLLSFVNRR